MQKIKNPWHSHPGYDCFGCSPNNPVGLQMDFYEDGDEIVSIWHPATHLQGWVNVLHGGIQATLCDEIASWVVFRKLQTTGVTATLEARYLKSVSTLDDHITLRARLLNQRRNLADIEVNLYNAADELCCTFHCTYFTLSKAKAEAEGFHGCELE